ncbi:MAG TPA: tetratricopeptide repeat protein, partial [Gemmatimonadaceae bacterium]|nr:tetratricopeptide repeat protein [Gemmatimonadaceae bacterium]
AVAQEEVMSAPVAPDAVAQDEVVPDEGAPDAAVPDAVAPDADARADDEEEAEALEEEPTNAEPVEEALDGAFVRAFSGAYQAVADEIAADEAERGLSPRGASAVTNLALERCRRLRDEVDAHPGDWARRRRLAEALFEAGERDYGLEELSATALGLEVEGALEDAARIVDELIRIAPDEIGYHQKRVELAVRLGDRDRLRDSYLDLADALVRLGHAARAEPVYVRVLELDPWDDRDRAALGDAAPPPPAAPPPDRRGDESYTSLADWLAEDDEPRDTRMRMEAPVVTGDEDADFDRLLQHFREGVARSLGEEDYDSHYDLGVAYKEMGLLDDAIAEFQRALRSPVYRLPAYEALGQCFIEQGSFPVAVTVLSRALHEPGLDDVQRVGVLFLLGYACEALQRRDEARSYYQRVYATDSSFRDVAERLTALDRGGR